MLCVRRLTADFGILGGLQPACSAEYQRPAAAFSHTTNHYPMHATRRSASPLSQPIPAQATCHSQPIIIFSQSQPSVLLSKPVILPPPLAVLFSLVRSIFLPSHSHVLPSHFFVHLLSLADSYPLSSIPFFAVPPPQPTIDLSNGHFNS